MEELFASLSDLSSFALPNNAALWRWLFAGEWALWAVLLISVVFLRSVLQGGRRRYRQQLADRIQSLEEVRTVSSDVLREGSSATIEILGAADNRFGTARLLRLERRTIAFSWPMDGQGDPLSLDIGIPLQITAASELAAFRFYTGVLDRHAEDEPATFFIARPEWVERVQRRRFFRINVDLPTTVSLPDQKTDAPHDTCAIIDNLSGGGFRLALPDRLEEGTHIRLRLPITEPSGTYDARVLKCTPMRRDPRMPYRAQCEFLFLAEETRDRLAKYCFDAQIEEIRARKRLPDG